MNKLNNNELMNISGGVKIGLIAGLIGLGAFIIGTIDGFLRPYACRS